MTIDEALHRVVRGHWLLILICVLLPVAGAAVLGIRTPDQYSAVGRVQLGSDLAASNVQADASSERALGIATSPGVVQHALEEAKLKENPITFARDHVKVKRVGVSPVIEISVTHTNAKQAATMATAITADVLQFANAGDRQSELERVATLDTSIAKLTKSRDALIPKLATASEGNVRKIQAEISAIQSTLAENQRQRSDLLVAAASRSSAVLLDAVRVPVVPMPSDTAQKTLLAGLLGLVGGFGLAALRETMRPTLHSPRAIGYAVDAPIIGHIGDRDTTTPASAAALARIADRVALLGRRHDTSQVLLIPVRDSDDVWANMVARELGKRGDKATAHRLDCAVMDGRWVEPGDSPAAVILAPHRMHARELRPAQELLDSVGWPILGVVTYVPGRRWTRPNFGQIPRDAAPGKAKARPPASPRHAVEGSRKAPEPASKT